MSIHKKYGETVILCDSCQAECAIGINFETALNNFRMLGGKLEKVDGQWYHYCSDICKANERRK